MPTLGVTGIDSHLSVNKLEQKRQLRCIKTTSRAPSLNIAKHGVSLIFAVQIMADPNRVEILDLRFGYGEDRWAVFGMVENRVWVCIHTPRGETRRIISAR